MQAFPPNWHDNASFLHLDSRFSQKVEEAKDNIVEAHFSRHTKQGSVTPQMRATARLPGSGVVTTPRVVAELSFGFWVRLLRPRFQMTLWGPALHKAFPPSTKRSTVGGLADRLLAMRNRIAHHEPIHDSSLTARYADLLLLAKWLSPDLEAWIKHHSRVDSLLADRPTPRQVF
jgi:hypothetical protein